MTYYKFQSSFFLLFLRGV
uniref:Uncharacterized protein n=1 Tax=Arundo donax TaxID=35708 RepID=A0A0A8YG39_ARUDO